MTTLYVYAGPNGSGKSSLRDEASEPDRVDLVIDPDRIARAISPHDPRAADAAAGKLALLLFRDGLAARRSMSLETTLAGHSALRRITAAKSAGYTVELRYVALDFVALNLQRVRARTAAGGHYISPHDIRRRYASSLNNLPQALSIVDRAILTDNSGRMPRPVAELIHGRIVRIVSDLPRWLSPLMALIDTGNRSPK